VEAVVIVVVKTIRQKDQKKLKINRVNEDTTNK
jgi:hypothetical protein